MNRQQVLDDIQQTLGKVPGFIQEMPDATLEQEWGIFKRFEVQETSIPPKYRELMGLTAAAIMHCWYCVNFHKAMAKMHGATDEEIQEATLRAKFTNGWSVYLNGRLYDKDKYIKELQDIGEYVKARSK